MGKFVRDTNIKDINGKYSANGVSSVSVSQQMKAEVLSKVTIPMYFYNVIVPQLGDYYAVYPVDFENKPVVCCPLHDEDTPSCRYYPDTESFYCFGCQKGGNVVNLHRYFAERMNGRSIEYEEAIDFLYNFFVRGKETTGFVEKQVLEPVQLNSDVDIIKFNVYRVNLENSLAFDHHISQEVKRKLWEELDDIDVLLTLDSIRASEAEQYLKKRVRELVK